VWAEQEGLTYDAACAGSTTGYFDGIGCQNISAYGVVSCEDRCSVFHGDVPDGEACTAMTFGSDKYSDCAQGLVCMGPFCTSCPTRPGEGDACPGVIACQDGLYCTGDEFCEPLLGEGESCADAFTGCGDDLYCHEPDLVCTAAVADGEACSNGFECQSDLCDFPGSNVCVSGTAFVCIAF
jgi:hypothetical protein